MGDFGGHLLPEGTHKWGFNVKFGRILCFSVKFGGILSFDKKFGGIWGYFGWAPPKIGKFLGYIFWEIGVNIFGSIQDGHLCQQVLPKTLASQETLSALNRSILRDEETADLTVRCGEKTFRVHRSFLCSR